MARRRPPQVIIMSETLARTLLSIFLMVSSFTAWGAIERETFEVSVVIPTRSFYVHPVQTGWIHLEQRLPYNSITGELGALSKHYRVSNTNGAVGARLAEPAYLSNGHERIDLRVVFHNVQLNLQTQQVATASEAGGWLQVDLDISAIKPDGGYRPGQYHGTVNIVFEALAP